MTPPTKKDANDNPAYDVDGRGQHGRDTSSSSRSTASSQMGDRSSSLPSVRGMSPTTPTNANAFKTPPSSRTGSAHTGSPSSLAIARDSPVPPSTRLPAVPIRPPAFRPVPTQAPGISGPPSRSQVIRAAAAAVRQAAPGQRATGSQSARSAASSARDHKVLPSTEKSGKFTSPNVRSAAPGNTSSASYARAATAGAPAAGSPQKSAKSAVTPLFVSTPTSDNYQSEQRRGGTEFIRATAPPSRLRLAADDNSAASRELKSITKTLFTSPPPPPRGSAQDSPAMMSACSSRQGSDMSVHSGGSRDDRRDMSPDMSERVATRGEYPTHTTTTDTLGFDYEFELDVAARPQRRPRSPDDCDEEVAKRYCAVSQRNPREGGDSNSPSQHVTGHRRNSEPALHNAEAATDSLAAPLTTDSRSNVSASQKSGTTGKKCLYVDEKRSGTDMKKVENTQQKKSKSPRYPPLIVERLPNWAAHFRAVRERLGHPPNARPYQQGIRFLPESAEEYRVVQRYLTDLEKDSGISWFAYSLAAERSVKLAIRGLPADTEISEIEEELRLHGLEPEYVRHIKARGERPGCIFHAVIKRTPDFRKVYDITTFLYMRGVKIEAWRGKEGPAQCHRCQKFRHSSHLCHRPLACVRCGENHAAKDCPRPKTEPATCANCAGDHPASNRRCPVFLREAKIKRAGTVASTKHQSGQQTAAERPTNAEEKETPSETLMAAANGPTNRQEAPSGRRRKNRRGGKKGKQTQPPTENESNKDGTTITATHKAQATAQTVFVAAEPEAQEPTTQRRARQTTGVNKAQTAALNRDPQKDINVAPTQQRHTRTTDEQSRQKTTTKPRQEFTACAIKLLMDLIKAIRLGQDIELVILDGLAELLAMYHG